MNAPPIPPPLPNAPPTQPGALGIRREASWPKTLGIVCLVIGVLGTLTNAAACVAALFGPKLAEGNPAMAAHMQKWMWWSAGSAAVGVALAVMLGAAGIGMMSRRRWSAAGGTMWAVLKLIHIVVGGVMTAVVSQEQLAATPMPAAVAGGMVMGGAVVGALISAVLPVIVLVMLRRAASGEEIASWR